jgi:aarF domain-containing kinase
LRAVGAGGARGAYAGQLEEGGLLTLLKVWVALETRQFALATVEEIERGVKYDLLSPNI